MKPTTTTTTTTMATMVLVVLLLVAIFPLLTVCYNLDVGRGRILSGENGTNFGYSVALWNDMEQVKRVVIGAPMWRSPTSGNETGTTPTLGQLLLCPPPSYQCQPYTQLPDLSKNSNSHYTTFAVKLGEVNKKQGIGFTEALYTSTSDSPSVLVACAPRYTTLFNFQSGINLYKRGACYLLTTPNSSFTHIIPFSNNFIQQRNTRKFDYNDERFTGHSLSGFSVALNQAQTLMYFGGPNAYRGQGVAGRIQKDNGWLIDYVSKSKMVNRTRLNYSYEGWTVTVGRFDGLVEAVAVSSPDAPILAGKVVFYSSILDPLEADPLTGEDAGDKFGFSLTSGDLDGDGSADLVVGAPLATQANGGHSLDNGKVYIFYSPTRKVPPPRERLVLTSGSGVEQGRFGWSITSVDLNQNGFHDVLVGEPGGAGAIYVFNGGRNGVSPIYSQRISASELTVPLVGLGFSLSTGTDMDSNGYPDVLVGAPLVDKAVFIRSAPVLKLTGDVTFDPPVISLANKTCQLNTEGEDEEEVVCFNLLLNLTYQSRHSLGPFDVIIELTLDGEEERAHFLHHHTFMIAVNRVLKPSEEPTELWRVPAYIKPGRPRLDTPLEVSVRALLPEGVESAITTTSPDLASSVVPPIMAPLALQASAPLTCPPDVICLPLTDILLSVNGSSPLSIGEEDVVLQVGIEPRLYHAYRVHLSLIYPVQLTFQHVSGDQFIPRCTVEVESQNQREEDRGMTGQLEMGGQGQTGHLNSLLSCNFTSQLEQDALVPLAFHFTYNITTMLEFLASADVIPPDLVSTNPVSLDPYLSDMTSPDPSSPDSTSLEPSLSDSTSPDPISNSTSPDPSTSSNSTSPDPSTSHDSTSPALRLPVFLLPHLTFRLAVTSDLPDLQPSDNSLVVNKTVYSMVNLQLLGQSQPDTVEGTLNKSASLAEVMHSPNLNSPSYLGPPVKHIFSLTNLGPSPLLHAKLNLFLPLHLEGGLPLLYLVTAPRVHGNLTCTTLSINPNNYTFAVYKSSEEDEDAEGEGTTYISEESTLTTTPSSTPATTTTSSTSSTPTSHTDVFNLFDIDISFRSKPRRKGIVDCNLVPCETMTCEVESLEVGESASVELSGYVVLASLSEVSGGSLAQLRSDASVEVPFQHQRQLLHPQHSTTTAAALTQVSIIGKPKRQISLDEVPWWVWVLVACISLFILLIIIIVCVKVGFFKRNRVVRESKPMIRRSTYYKKGDDNDYDIAEIEAFQ
ncbi:hypothetical protein Pmani_005319 [Petrolisthes manimaculis]|uniref:Integrin alpha third immunoglobulin-like domain-containing protein n=1 Tax=Petrolisthes manimaculis TaxID=1843537 RepID=A0AAE1QBY0_9EUCA|nr:hypothetical protein Pmani_005319 [Petrolisthes manimaculis]